MTGCKETWSVKYPQWLRNCFYCEQYTLDILCLSMLIYKCFSHAKEDRITAPYKF